MLSFEQVCQELKNAELVRKRETTYKIIENPIPDPLLQRKVNKKFQDYWKERSKPDDLPSKPFAVGYCEIGRFTGCEFMWFCSHILKNDDLCKYGNCLYLSVKNLAIAAILFLGANQYHLYFPKLVTKSQHGEESMDFSDMFARLFDDDTLKDRRVKNPESAIYSQEKINHLRSQAKSEYSKFLKTPLAEFLQIPFLNVFLGVVLDCAFRGCPKNPVKTGQVKHTLIPFAACVKLAFDQEESGKIHLLFGEVREPQEKSELLGIKAKAILETAKQFISK